MQHSGFLYLQTSLCKFLLSHLRQYRLIEIVRKGCPIRGSANGRAQNGRGALLLRNIAPCNVAANHISDEHVRV